RAARRGGLHPRGDRPRDRHRARHRAVAAAPRTPAPDGGARPMTMPPHDTHPELAALHDLVDDRLSPAARSAVDAHLATCDACARQVARLRALLATAAALPRGLDPAGDGWPALRDTLAGRASADVARREASTVARARRTGWLRGTLAAAAVLLVVVAGWRAL